MEISLCSDWISDTGYLFPDAGLIYGILEIKGKSIAMEKNRLLIDDALYETEVPDDVIRKNRITIKDLHEIRAVIPGTISKIMVLEGQEVVSGQVLLILEAMKMLNDVEAEIEGTIAEINVSEGDRVEKGQLLVRME